MPEVLIDGVGFNVAELGPTEQEAHPPVVMLHGLLLGNLATWYLGCGPMLARRRRVVCYDLRGHGRSQRPATGYSVAAMADDLGGLIERLELGPRVDLVGHSYGALIALEHRRRYPERVRRLVLVEPPLAPGDLGEVESFLSRSPEQMAQSLPAGLALAGRRARRLVEGMLALATETELVRVLAEREGVPDAVVAGLGAETLVVFGAESPCRAQAARIAALAPSARVEVLPGGHFLPLQAPGPLSERIVHHLEGDRG